jgi:hypothetical protein
MVVAMRTALDGDAGKMGEMKRLSQRFRRKELGAEPFLEQMVNLVGLEGLKTFFDDMVLLLAMNDAEQMPVAVELRRMYRAKQQAAARDVLTRRHFHREPAPAPAPQPAAASPAEAGAGAGAGTGRRPIHDGFDDLGGPGPSLAMDAQQFPGLSSSAPAQNRGGGGATTSGGGGGGGGGGGNLRWSGSGGGGMGSNPGRSNADDFPSLGGGASAAGDDYPTLGGGAGGPGGVGAAGWVGSTPAREDPMSIAALKKRGKKTKKGVVIRIA